MKPDSKLLNDIQPGDPNRDPFGKIPGLMENGQPTPAYKTRAEIGELINQRFSGVDKSVDVLENQIKLPKWVANELGLESQNVSGNKLLRGKAADAIDAERLATKPPEKQYGYGSDSEKLITETGDPQNQRILHAAGIKVLSRLISRGSDLNGKQDMQKFAEATYFLFQGPIKNRGSDSVIRGFVSSIGRQLTGKPMRLPQDVDIQSYARSQKDFTAWLVKSLQHLETPEGISSTPTGRNSVDLSTGMPKSSQYDRVYPSATGKPRGMLMDLEQVNTKYGENGVRTIDKTQQKAREIIDSGASKRSRGPVVSGITDPVTGETYFGQNFTEKERNNLDFMTKFKEQLHPLLKERLEEYTLKLKVGEIKAEDPLSLDKGGIPGTHSEIRALDQALKSREVYSGKSVTGDDLSSFLLHNRSLNDPTGVPPRCAHCWHLTDGITVIGND
jgi:hypothetical protein